MKLRVGYELQYAFPQPTPAILMLNIHFTRVSDLAMPDHIIVSPSVPISGYRDGFGNWCSRIVAPTGACASRLMPFRTIPACPIQWFGRAAGAGRRASGGNPRLPSSEPLLRQRSTVGSGLDIVRPRNAGLGRVQAICDLVHQRIAFGYEHARVTRTASEAYQEGRGVCRDYAHLAVAFCRALNIPARYCTGYLGDVGTPPPYPPGDFAAWFEAYLGGHWYTFDPRNNVPRIGRVLLARGRDAADVAIITTFGPNTLEGFRVWTDEISDTSVDRPDLPVRQGASTAHRHDRGLCSSIGHLRGSGGPGRKIPHRFISRCRPENSPAPRRCFLVR